MDTLNKITEGIAKKHAIVFGCHCSVRYSGRAESFLDFGDRIILIKEDQTLIIHQPWGNAPVNYMKPGSVFQLSGKILSVKNDKEWIELDIKQLHFLHSLPLADGASIELQGTEKDMADMILLNPELIELGFKIVSREEQTKYGFIDVMGYDVDGVLTIIECKRYTGDLKAVDQLRRYVEKIKASKGIQQVRGILACPSITTNTKAMLKDWGFEFKSITPPMRLERYNKSQVSLTDY